MSLLPSVRVSTSATLQRPYFTSELFVSAARADVDGLLSSFEHLAEEEPEPYAIFKSVWMKEGWNYSHLLIWEDTARAEYIHTMFRLFLERVQEDESELLQVGAFFALYTLFMMQLASTTLYRVKHIPITIDTLKKLATLAESSTEPHQPHILYILHQLLAESYFFILPSSTLGPYSPTSLPNSHIDRSLENQSAKQVGKGGKTRIDLDKAGRRKWQMLSTWVDERAGFSMGGQHSRPSHHQYAIDKAAVLDLISNDLETTAEENALAKLKALPKSSDAPSEGIRRFENMLENRAHILRNQWQDAS